MHKTCNVWAPEGCPAHLGTRRVPGTFGHRKGAQAHMCSAMVPGHIWAKEGCPVTFGHRKGARAHMGTGMVPGHI